MTVLMEYFGTKEDVDGLSRGLGISDRDGSFPIHVTINDAICKRPHLKPTNCSGD